jgi:hypothetical protein
MWRDEEEQEEESISGMRVLKLVGSILECFRWGKLNISL